VTVAIVGELPPVLAIHRRLARVDDPRRNSRRCSAIRRRSGRSACRNSTPVVEVALAVLVLGVSLRSAVFTGPGIRAGASTIASGAVYVAQWLEHMIKGAGR
jgi:hypothetical protein